MAHAPGAIDQQLRYYVLDHLLDVVKASCVEDDPFPHFAVRGFFPRDLYTHLLDSLPPSSDYESFDYKKHSNRDGESNRRRYRLENACLDRMSGEAGGFWRTLRSVLADIELKRAVFHQLRHGLAYRYDCQAEDAADTPGFALPELFRETAGYRIKPHPDTRKKVVTMQISLARDAGQEQLGTEFYRRSLSVRDWLREPRGFEVVKSMPLLPNAAYAFVVLNTVRRKSWHGRSMLAAQSGVRDTLLNIWYANAEHANRDVFEELPAPITLPRAA